MDSEKVAAKIVKHFASFGISLKIVLLEMLDGGSRLIFGIKPKKGTKIHQLFDRANDIQIALGLSLFQLYWEGQHIRLTVSDKPVMENNLEKMLASPAFCNNKMKIPIALGYDMRGRMFFADLVAFVHAMYGGATGSGKTVGLRSLIASLVYFQPVSRVNLVIIDTFTNKLHLFNPLPHLVLPVVKEKEQVVCVLKNLVLEMERRLRLPTNELRILAALVVIIDEYINLIKSIDGTLKSEFLSVLTSLLRLGRQAKIHVVLATQEPGKGDMQISLNNLDGRIAFHCSNVYNSVSILGCKGAETLPGKGAMYFKAPGQDPIPLQGAEMIPVKLEKLVAHIASKAHDLSNKFILSDSDVTLSPVWSAGAQDSQKPKQNNENELANIILWALGQDDIAADRIKKRFHMSHRAYDIINRLNDMGIIADKFANQPRAVLPINVEDVPTEVMELLTKHGISAEDVTAAIASRGQSGSE